MLKIIELHTNIMMCSLVMCVSSLTVFMFLLSLLFVVFLLSIYIFIKNLFYCNFKKLTIFFIHGNPLFCAPIDNWKSCPWCTIISLMDFTLAEFCCLHETQFIQVWYRLLKPEVYDNNCIACHKDQNFHRPFFSFVTSYSQVSFKFKCSF